MPGSYAYCKVSELSRDTITFLQDSESAFLCMTKTDDELSILCEVVQSVELEQHCGEVLEVEDDFKCFKVQGKLDFSEIGIIAQVAGALASKNISLCNVSTFDTDYFFVKDNKFKEAKLALEEAGCVFEN